MSKKYQIHPLFWSVRDEASVKFHVENNDYFGTIAAILSLIKQELKKDDNANAVTFSNILKNIEDELLFLQKNYHINPNNKKRKTTPKGKLISQ